MRYGDWNKRNRELYEQCHYNPYYYLIKKIMEEESNEVQNVHEDKTESEYQVKLSEKAKGLIDYLSEEPQAGLVPMLKISEQGIIPDVKLILKGEQEDGDNSTETEETGEGDDADSGEETTDAESTDSPSEER